MTAPEARFTGLAADYAKARPDYPPAAFEAMVRGLARPVRAVDIGCGTGISTRQLATVADQVIGVEPNSEMLDQAKASKGHSPGLAPLEWRSAPAEQTGLPAGEFGLVLAAQAFHWFDADRALAEFARILRPGGRAALLWNLRDDRDPVTAAYSAIAVPHAMRHLDATTIRARAEGGEPLARSRLFRNARRVDFIQTQHLDLEGTLQRARSASYFPRQGAERAAALDALRGLFAERSHDGLLTLRYRTELHMAERPE